jgi:hypothetical protein
MDRTGGFENEHITTIGSLLVDCRAVFVDAPARRHSHSAMAVWAAVVKCPIRKQGHVGNK